MGVTQDAFVTALLDPAWPVPDGLVTPDGRPAARRFNVYRNNVSVSLSEALGVAFPALKKLIGDENFTALARLFARAHPPSNQLLMHYGEKLPGFLDAFAPLRHIGYLPDVARLEVALRESYHAADAAPVDPSALAALPPETLLTKRVRLAPALRLLRSPWPVASVWRFNMVEGAPKPVMQAEDVAILRPGFDPEVVTLGPGAYAFLTALLGGATIGDAFDAGASEAQTFDLAALLAQLLAGDAITALED